MEIKKLNIISSESQTQALLPSLNLISRIRFINFSELINTVKLSLMKFTHDVKEKFTEVKDDLQTLVETHTSNQQNNSYPDKEQEKKNLTSKIKERIQKLILRVRQKFSGRNFRRRDTASKIFSFSLIAVAIIVIIAVVSSVTSISTRRAKTDLAEDDRRIDVLGAKASMDINKEFTFPLNDEKGEEVSRIKYFIKSVELRDEIVVQGKKATSVKGRTFLIINIEITNDFNQTIEMNTKDFVRLTANGDEEKKLAPDIHNDPVEIQAISTKLTRLGFPINDNDTSLALHVGELTKDKEKIDLNF